MIIGSGSFCSLYTGNYTWTTGDVVISWEALIVKSDISFCWAGYSIVMSLSSTIIEVCKSFYISTVAVAVSSIGWGERATSTLLSWEV